MMRKILDPGTPFAFKHYECFYKSGLYELNHVADSIQVLCLQMFITVIVIMKLQLEID